MAQRRSVLEPKPKVIYADDQTLVRRLNWRRWQTWGVFLGLGLALASAMTIVIVLCAITVELATCADSGGACRCARRLVARIP